MNYILLPRLWLARHVQNQSRITLMRRICSFTDFYCVLLDLSAPAGRWDFHGLTLAGGNPAPYRRKYNPCSFLHWVFLTRIYRIDADATFVGRYCLPDSSHYMLYKSRDFVPGYSRSARYCLPDSSYCARSPRSKSITDNADATDLFFTDFVFMWIDMRLYGALIFTDYHYSMDYLRIISCWGISSAVQAQEKIRKKPRPSISKI